MNCGWRLVSELEHILDGRPQAKNRTNDAARGPAWDRQIGHKQTAEPVRTHAACAVPVSPGGPMVRGIQYVLFGLRQELDRT